MTKVAVINGSMHPSNITDSRQYFLALVNNFVHSNIYSLVFVSQLPAVGSLVMLMARIECREVVTLLTWGLGSPNLGVRALIQFCC